MRFAQRNSCRILFIFFIQFFNAKQQSENNGEIIYTLLSTERFIEPDPRTALSYKY